MAKTPLDLSGLLTVKKSHAAPAADAPPHSAAEEPDAEAGVSVPLNFRVPASFRRRFRVFAARHDLKLSDLLRLAFDEYEIRHRSR